jgi:hypothetical protein
MGLDQHIFDGKHDWVHPVADALNKSLSIHVSTVSVERLLAVLFTNWDWAGVVSRCRRSGVTEGFLLDFWLNFNIDLTSG